MATPKRRHSKARTRHTALDVETRAPRLTVARSATNLSFRIECVHIAGHTPVHRA